MSSFSSPRLSQTEDQEQTMLRFQRRSALWNQVRQSADTVTDKEDAPVEVRNDHRV